MVVATAVWRAPAVPGQALLLQLLVVVMSLCGCFADTTQYTCLPYDDPAFAADDHGISFIQEEWVDNLVIPEENDEEHKKKLKEAQNSLVGADDKDMKCKCSKSDCKCKKRCSCRMKNARRRLLSLLTKPTEDNPFRCNCDFQKGDLDFTQGTQMDCKCDKAACSCERKCMCEDKSPSGSGSNDDPRLEAEKDARR